MLTPKTYVYAHRGASGYAPENTLEAFRLAAEMGADGVELDVHFSKDGQVMVLHDAKIDRTSNGQGEVSSYTREELLAFDFGFQFYKECRGIRIPTLDEVYELLAPTGLTVNVEIKLHSPDMLTACDTIAKKYEMQDRVIYSSFDHLQMARMKEVNPDSFTAPLYAFNMIRPWDYCLNMQANASHPHIEQLRVFPEYVEKCHSLGLRVHPWTLNKEDDMRFAFEADCDAIITNYPDVALRLRDER